MQSWACLPCSVQHKQSNRAGRQRDHACSSALAAAGRCTPMHLRPCRTAYEQETRKIILSLENVTKVAPNGKQILNKVGLGELRSCQVRSGCSHADVSCLLQVPLPQTCHVRAACAQACTSAPRSLS